MASTTGRTSRKRTRENVDYKQLNSFSSAVIYDTTPRRNRSKFFDVERIIERRRCPPKGYEYLIKWSGWPFHSCSWEPSENLTLPLLRSYEQPPKPHVSRLEAASRNFLHGIQTCLKSKSLVPCYVSIDLDVWRYVTFKVGVNSEHKGHRLYGKDDLKRFVNLPDDWFYTLNKHGEGTAIEFPIKAKAIVSWSASKFLSQNGELKVAPRVPLEKVKIEFAKRACNIDNI